MSRPRRFACPLRPFFSHGQLTGILVYLTRLCSRYGKILCQFNVGQCQKKRKNGSHFKLSHLRLCTFFIALFAHKVSVGRGAYKKRVRQLCAIKTLLRREGAHYDDIIYLHLSHLNLDEGGGRLQVCLLEAANRSLG